MNDCWHIHHLGYVTSHQVKSAFHPSGVGKQTTSLLNGLKARRIHQVTQQVMSHGCGMGFSSRALLGLTVNFQRHLVLVILETKKHVVQYRVRRNGCFLIQLSKCRHTNIQQTCMSLLLTLSCVFHVTTSQRHNPTKKNTMVEQQFFTSALA